MLSSDKSCDDLSMSLQITQGLCPANCFSHQGRVHQTALQTPTGSTTPMCADPVCSPLPSCRALLNGFSCFSYRMAVWVYWCRRVVHVFSNLVIWKKEKCYHFGKGTFENTKVKAIERSVQRKANPLTCLFCALL